MKIGIIKKLTGSLLAFVFLAAVTACFAEDLKTEVDKAIEVFNKTDPTLKDLFQRSAGYIVFPSVGRGGLVFGGKHGKGLAFQKGKLIGEVTLSEFNFGAQIGGASYYELLFLEMEQNVTDLKQNKTTISAQVNAIAAAEGAARSAKFEQGIMVFSIPRTGLMAQATIGGQKLEFEPIYEAPKQGTKK